MKIRCLYCTKTTAKKGWITGNTLDELWNNMYLFVCNMILAVYNNAQIPMTFQDFRNCVKIEPTERRGGYEVSAYRDNGNYVVYTEKEGKNGLELNIFEFIMKSMRE